MNLKTHQNGQNKFVKDDGFVLLLIVLTILAIAGAIVLAGVAGNSLSRERFDAEAAAKSDVLQQAKLSLLGYAASVTNGATGYRLGNLPTPDVLNATATGILYDGFSDSNKCLGKTGGGLPGVVGGNTNKRCLGKFPIKDLPLALGITDAHDPAGKVPWLAISANLDFSDSCLNIVNSEVLNFAYTAFSCPTLPTLSTSLPYPWLTVYDKNGVALSSRVAAVLIMPGEALTTETRSQARSPSAPGLPTDYLDPIALPLGCTSSCVKTFDNAGLANEFISIAAGTLYPADAEDTAKRGQPIKFNDVVVYITIDELIAFLEKRVLKEMASAVNELSGPLPKKNIGFPWAAPYATAPDSYAKFASAPGKVTGLFPFFVAVTTPAPPLGFPSYQTDLNWTIAGLSNPSKTCVQVENSPSNRWINTRQGITAAVAASGTSPLATTSCTWKGPGALSCDGTITSSPTLTFQHFSSLSRCNAGTPVSASPPTYTRNRTITITMDATCSGALTNAYVAASATQPQSWSWNCTSVQNTFTVDISEDFTTTTLPATGSASFNGTGSSATVTNMRYQPVMPYWFYQNEWYKTAFYALSPALRPAPIAHNCGAATTLTVGGSSLDNGLVILAGSRLPNLPLVPAQPRPSANIADYMEPTAPTDFANCIFRTASACTGIAAWRWAW